jgi:hypothetical protein
MRIIHWIPLSVQTRSGDSNYLDVYRAPDGRQYELGYDGELVDGVWLLIDDTVGRVPVMAGPEVYIDNGDRTSPGPFATVARGPLPIRPTDSPPGRRGTPPIGRSSHAPR